MYKDVFVAPELKNSAPAWQMVSVIPWALFVAFFVYKVYWREKENTMYLLFAVLSITGLGCLAGIMMSVKFVLGPFWEKLDPVSFRSVFRTHGDHILGLLPYVLVPTLGGLIAINCICWNPTGLVKVSWALATACLLAVVILTRFWFFPRNKKLLADNTPPETQRKTLRVWLLVQNARILLLVAAAVAGVLGVAFQAR